MEKRPSDLTPAEQQEKQHTVPAESTPEKKPVPSDEEHTHSNYLFALKVLGVLLAIIAVIIILKASGVPIAIKDWFSEYIGFVPFISPSSSLTAHLF